MMRPSTTPRTAARLILCLVAACALHGLAHAAEAARAKPRSVLFLLSDDQRYDTLHALGNPIIQTPHLDRLVERGFAFRNNYVMGSMGGAVCLPSRAMIHSGRTLWHADLTLQSGPLWGRLFQDRGFATFGTGKWHNGRPSFARAFQTGKAVFFGGMSDHLAVPVQDLDAAGKWSPQRPGEKFSSVLFADAAVEFLRGRARDKPFFLYVALTAPHDPRMPPAEYARLYDPEKIPLPKNFLPQHPFDNGDMYGRDELLAPHPRPPEAVRRHIAEYYGMISHLDAQVGRVLKALEETGGADDTLIVFTGDNGLALGQHGLMGKQNLYEHSGRMPLVFAGPGVAKGASDALVYLLDIFPTACEFVGVPVPAEVEGRSLAPVMRGEKQQVREYIFTAYRDIQRAVREPRWKLIKYHVGGVKTAQLFDLARDPDEMQNLADDPACAEHRKRLEGLMEKSRAEWNDPIDFEGRGGKPSSGGPAKGGAPAKR